MLTLRMKPGGGKNRSCAVVKTATDAASPVSGSTRFLNDVQKKPARVVLFDCSVHFVLESRNLQELMGL